jgi:amidohydrolase
MPAWPTPAAADLLTTLIESAQAHLPQAAQLRHEIHKYPELSGHELVTAERIMEYLPDFDIFQLPQAGFGLRVGAGFGPTVAIRAELDALPVVEETGVEWSATGAAMHACGHDIHMAALWTLIMAAAGAELPIPLLAIFQSAEEVQPSGAETLIKDGGLAEHEIAAVIGAHVQPRLPAGVISTGAGAVNAATDDFELVVFGEPGHGAYPHLAVDPIPVLAAIIQGFQEIVSRDINPMHPAVITIGEIHAGTAGNIIPESGRMSGIIRSFDEEDRLKIRQRIDRMAENTATARGARVEITWHEGDPVLVNNPELVHYADPLIEEAGLPLTPTPFRSTGSDDFAHYTHIAPTMMSFVGTGTGSGAFTRGEIALHHPKFLPSDNAIETVMRTLAAGYVAGAKLAGAL